MLVRQWEKIAVFMPGINKINREKREKKERKREKKQGVIPPSLKVTDQFIQKRFFRARFKTDIVNHRW